MIRIRGASDEDNDLSSQAHGSVAGAQRRLLCVLRFEVLGSSPASENQAFYPFGVENWN